MKTHPGGVPLPLIRLAVLAGLLLIPFTLTQNPVRAAPNPLKGIQPGAPVDNNGNLLISPEVADQLAASNATYVRLNLKNPWCTDTPEFYAAYDTIIDLLQERGLIVIALLSNEFKCGNQTEWNEDAWEVTGGDSYNLYIDQFGYQAGRAIAHYRTTRGVRYWEIWNEPNCYSTAPGEGCSYIWPSIFSRLLGHVYTQAKYYNQFDVEIISGGLLAHNLYGNNPESAAVTYLQNTYDYGVNRGDWSWIMDHAGSYPLDQVGYHTYLSTSGTTLAADLSTYLDWIRDAYAAYEGSSTTKNVFITEIGWRSDGIGETPQADNLTTAFDVTLNTPYVSVTTWFFLHDSYAWAEKWGLLREDGSLKPAWYAFGGAPPPSCSTVPLPIPQDGWRVKIWDNPDFNGDPVEIRTEAPGEGGFLFDWGGGRASECAGYDHFAIRFERQAYFPASGMYYFSVAADGGIRLWVDNELILDNWDRHIPGSFAYPITLEAGWHDLRVDYHEETGNASVQLSWQGMNIASVVSEASTIPTNLAPGEIITVTIRIQNSGTSIWRASNLHRLGALSSNQVIWSNWQCGGYSHNPTDARAFLCHDVLPGQTHDFRFSIRAPDDGSPTTTLAVRMVQDGFEWFGEGQVWNIPLSQPVYLPTIFMSIP